MTEIIKIIGVAFVTAITAMLLRSTKPELSFAVTVTGVLVILLFVVDALQETLSLFSSIAKATALDDALVKLLIKIVGVGYLTEFAAGILGDFGCNSVADKVVFSGKITIFLLSIPIMEGVLQTVRAFLGLA